MGQADEYRVKAAAFRAEARHVRDLSVRGNLESLARAYVRLAEQAEKNRHLNTYARLAEQSEADSATNITFDPLDDTKR